MDNITQLAETNTPTKTRYHIYLLIVVTILLLIGTATIFSCTQIIDIDKPFAYINKHFINIFISLILFSIVAFIDYKKFKKFSLFLYIGTFILLIFPIFSHAIKGAHRWISLGFFNFQPSELAKIVIVIVMATFLERQKDKINIWKYDILPCIYVGLFCGIILIGQRDLGSTILIGSIWFALLIIAKIDIQRIISICAIGVMAVIGAILIEPYRFKRILDNINSKSTETATEISYNMKAAFAAIGSGGIFGKGSGQSEMKLNHLPEMQTDFIFPIICEEHGFIGAMIVVGCYIWLMYLILQINKNCKDDYGKFLSFGILLILILQTIINMSMTTGLIPAKGFPLPFISYGGSSLMINFIMIGILFNISRSNNK